MFFVKKICTSYGVRVSIWNVNRILVTLKYVISKIWRDEEFCTKEEDNYRLTAKTKYGA